MATAGNNATTNAGIVEANGGSNVPQWKRDLIQRRRQQSKVLANNGASVKLCSAVIGTSSSAGTADGGVEHHHALQEYCPVAGPLRAVRATTTTASSEYNNVAVGVAGGAVGGSSGNALLSSSPSSYPARRPTGGAIVAAAAAATSADLAPTVAYNMRLEADLSLCSDAEDVVNGAPAKFAADMSERKTSEYAGDSVSENEEAATTRTSGETVGNESASQRDETRVVGGRGGKEPYGEATLGSRKTMKEPSRTFASNEDAESDSSEELQYGPGIVNKLKSKYLNLTLRETNKSRASVQRFRRAASLEDLLDRDDDETAGHEKTARKYAKRDGVVVVPKSDRYRNASRGNESMKRARSVETLMRYNSVTVDETGGALRSRPANGVRQEPVNDHIILVDRTSVKIESRLGDLDRPKPINKPKRIKPVLAETERPPPDLVKTTMRIFEGSARKLKPKGEVAAKVATFKTINDTFKAQTTQKKLVKPPVQPKPFVNGSARGGVGSPKRIVLPQKPTAELIETQDGEEEYHIDGVITEPIVQSVSSVVSKFQQIEKSHSPSPSPEPSGYQKLKFSPANSPEPPTASCKSKLSSALEITIKSPPVTPVLSPRISSPRLQSPSSPVKDSTIRFQASSLLHKPPLPSPGVREASKAESAESSKPPRPPTEKEPAKTSEPRLPESSEPKEDVRSSRVGSNDATENVAEEEIVDGPRTISKSALDNIGRAGTTMQFNFGDAANKTYLPGAKRAGQKFADERDDERSRGKSVSSASVPLNIVTTSETNKSQERLEEKVDDDKEDVEEKPIVPESKPIGAICSLGLIKPATTTASTYPQSNNETKTIRCQKSEFSPPQKQIGIIRPLVSTKTQHTQQNLSNRELEKNLINRVKSIEQPTKVVVSLKSADEIQPAKKTSATAGGGLWDTKPWNQQNNTMVFNFSNRKDVPDYIENDGLIIRRKREKPKVSHRD